MLPHDAEADKTLFVAQSDHGVDAHGVMSGSAPAERAYSAAKSKRRAPRPNPLVLRAIKNGPCDTVPFGKQQKTIRAGCEVADYVARMKRAIGKIKNRFLTPFARRTNGFGMKRKEGAASERALTRHSKKKQRKLRYQILQTLAGGRTIGSPCLQ
jgi:hypothetical protein